MKTPTPLHIFKAGVHVPMDGGQIAFTESDLAATAAAYDPAIHQAPIVVGHPKVDAPAYGWVASLAAAPNGLSATHEQVDPEFAEMVNAGRFKKISAAFYAPDAASNPVPGVWYLKHVGFLGAAAPAVKGLRTAHFAESEPGVVEFSDWADMQNAGLWRNLREWFIAKFGLEEADKVVPSYSVANLEDAARQDDDKPVPFAEPTPPTLPTQPQEPPTVTPEQKAALEAENAALKQRIAEQEAKAKADAQAKLDASHASFAEDLVAQGKLEPKNKALVLQLLGAVESASGTVEFSEGDKKEPLAKTLMAFLTDRDPVVNLGEHATLGRATGQSDDGQSAYFAEGVAVDQERLGQDTKIRQYMAANKVDYRTAARAIIK